MLGEPPVRMQLSGTPGAQAFEVHDGSTIPAAGTASPPGPGFGVDDTFDLDAFDALDEQFATLAPSGAVSTSWPAPGGLGCRSTRRARPYWCRSRPPSWRRAAPTSRSPTPAARFAEGRPGGEVAVQINGVPVVAFGRFQRHYRDLRREIAFLALAHQDDRSAKVLSSYDASSARCGPTWAVSRSTRRATRAADDIDLGWDAAKTFAQIGGLIDLLDAAALSRAQRLLTAPRGTDQRAFQIWFLGEFQPAAPRSRSPGRAVPAPAPPPRPSDPSRLAWAHDPGAAAPFLAVQATAAHPQCRPAVRRDAGPARRHRLPVDHLRDQRPRLRPPRRPVPPPLARLDHLSSRLGPGVLGGFTTFSATSEQARALLRRRPRASPAPTYWAPSPPASSRSSWSAASHRHCRPRAS